MNLKKFIIFSKNKFTITISDEKNISEYTFFNPIKVLVSVMLAGFIISIVYIIYIYIVTSRLKANLEVIEDKKNYLLSDIDSKHQELTATLEKLGSIEPLTIIKKGLKNSTLNNNEIIAKLDKIALNLAETKMLFYQVPSGSPLSDIRISSKYGMRIHPITGKEEFHKGIDLISPLKSNIYATANGVVEFSGYSSRSGYGNLVIVSHNFGFRTTYGHLYKVLVKTGTFVKKGDIIGLSGNSGMSTGPHLHYEIRYMTILLDPKSFLYWKIVNYKNIFKKERKVKWQSLIKGVKTQLQEVQDLHLKQL